MHATKLFVTLVPTILIGSQLVYAAPPLRFTDLPGVYDMFLPPPPPTPLPNWDTWEPAPPSASLPIPEIIVTYPINVAEPIAEPIIEPITPPPIVPPPPEPPLPPAEPPLEPTEQPIEPTDPAPMPHPLGLGDISGHWAEQAITYAFNRGLIFTPSDGVFRPNQNITRGEFAFMLERWITANYAQLQSLGFIYAGENLTVLGVPEYHHFRHSIVSLAFMGMVGGDAPFMPDEYVQRQEITRILLNLFLRLPNSDFNVFYFNTLNAEEILARYSDQNQIASWARDSVAIMVDRGFMGTDTDTFRPASPLSRAEAYVVFYNVERWLESVSQ